VTKKTITKKMIIDIKTMEIEEKEVVNFSFVFF